MREARRLAAAPYHAVVEVQMEASETSYRTWLPGAAEGMGRLSNGAVVPGVTARSCPLVATVGENIFLGGVDEVVELVGLLMVDAFVCTCDVGWMGERCDEKDMQVWALCSRMCSGRGACKVRTSETSKTGECLCEVGWMGEGCQTRQKPVGCCRGGAAGATVTEDCAGNGVCSEDREAGVCSCACFGGYGGLACEIGIEEDGDNNATAAAAADEEGRAQRPARRR